MCIDIYGGRVDTRRNVPRRLAAEAMDEITAPHGVLSRVGGWCARHSALVIAAWLVLLAAATAGNRALGGSYADDFNLSGTQSVAGANLLQQHEPSAGGGQSGQVVFAVSSGSLASHGQAIEQSVQDVARLPHVTSASDPLTSRTTAKDGRVAYSIVQFDTNPVKLGPGYVSQVDSATSDARDTGVQVNYGGALGQAARPTTKDIKSEVIGIVVAIAVLLIGFGSVIAAGLPTLSGIIGVITGLGLLGMLAAETTFATVSPTLAAMMGIGVGIDYGLFLSTRHRQLMMDGAVPRLAAARTIATSGRAIITAALTVIVALLGLYVSGISFIGKLGLAAGITVAVAALSAITLVPALLGLAGRRIDKLRVRRPRAEATTEGTGWQAYAARVGRHPWRYLVAGAAVLAVLAVPLFSIQLGHIDAGADPSTYTDRIAYDQISSAFGAGANGPFTIVVDVRRTPHSAIQALEQDLPKRLGAAPDVASVAPVRPTPDGALLTTTVIPASSPQDAATDTLMNTLRDATLPQALKGTGATSYVTGSTAFQLDFRNQIGARLPLIIGVVIATAFLLLLVSFRSPVLALKAAVLNLLSIGASYGVVVAVFQWGWGGSLFGVAEKVPVESYVPMMMFAIVFGLSMDYEVFLLSRVREAWLASRDSQRSVAAGLAATARVISCAALIMTSVFAAFLLSTNVVVKMLALGLGVSVLIDATIVRLVIVPAAMFLMGRANWWIPRWLDRLLPRFDPEGSAQLSPPPARPARLTRCREADG
jgi:RND superfamily putative drug exporter